MSDNPPPRPPPIAYRSNNIPDPNPRRNTPLKFIGRMCLGICLGVGGCVAGGFLASYTNVQWLFFVPLGAVCDTEGRASVQRKPLNRRNLCQPLPSANPRYPPNKLSGVFRRRLRTGRTIFRILTRGGIRR